MDTSRNPIEETVERTDKKMRTVLSIAGSDPSGGAGIQADLKTFGACGVYGMAVVTALTAQNTMGVQGVWEVSGDCLSTQLDSVFEDIFPDAVKIGMVSSSELIMVIADKLKFYKPKVVVLDPILVSTSGTTLLRPEAEESLRKYLFPLADVLTPNIPECERLSGIHIQDKASMEQAARELALRYQCSVICKGGHMQARADDLVYREGVCTCVPGERIACANNHGTGCTYSSALAAYLAQGFELEESASRTKEFMQGALADGLDLGKGNGPLNHFWNGGKKYE